MIAERTGRTLEELNEMSTKEFTQWVALITIVEPYEKKKQQEQQQQ